MYDRETVCFFSFCVKLICQFLIDTFKVKTEGWEKKWQNSMTESNTSKFKKGVLENDKQNQTAKHVKGD